MKNTIYIIAILLFTSLVSRPLIGQSIPEAEKTQILGDEVWAVSTSLKGSNEEITAFVSEYMDDNFDTQLEQTFAPEDKYKTFTAKNTIIEEIMGDTVDVLVKNINQGFQTQLTIAVEMKEGVFLNPEDHPALFLNAREMVGEMVREYWLEQMEADIKHLEDDENELEKVIRKGERTLKRNNRKLDKNAEKIAELKEENQELSQEAAAVETASEYNENDLNRIQSKLDIKQQKLEDIRK